MTGRLRESALRVLLLAPFAGAILHLHAAHGVAYDAFIFGSGAWGFAVALKMLLHHGVIRRLPHAGDWLGRTALANGLASGVCELGMALAAFAFLGGRSFAELLAFGIGIGTIEAFLVATPGDPLRGTSLGPAAAELQRTVDGLTGGARLVHRDLLPIAERWTAAVFHIGSRGLVYITYAAGNPLPFLLALAGFVYTDGWAGYRLLYSGRLADLAVLRRFYLEFAGLAAGLLLAFLWLWSRMAASPALSAAG
jgi:hypothetical protein